MAVYKSKKAVEDAIKKNTGSKDKVLTKTQAIKKIKVEAYEKQQVGNLSAIRSGAIGSGDLNVICRWTCSIKAGWIDHFDLDIEYYSTRRKAWVQLNNNVISVPTTSTAQTGSTVFYTYTFSAPSDVDCAKLRFHVHPISKEREVTITFYTAEKITSGKNKDKWQGKKNTEKVSKPYFSKAPWSDWKELSPAPAVQDSNDATAKLKAEKPARPAKPGATLMSNGSVDVTFDAIDTSTAANARRVYRCADGKYDKDPELISNGNITAAGTSHFVDSKAVNGHEYRYFLYSVNTRSNTWSPTASLPADLSDAVKMPPIEITGLTAACYGDDGARVTFSYPTSAYFPALSSVKVYYANDRNVLVTNKTSCQSVDVVRGSRNMSAIINGLDAGYTWYFSVWLKTGDSEQCELFSSSVASCTIASVPEAPTMGIVAPAAYVGDSVDVAWTHNNADGSAQTAAQIYVSVRKSGTTTYTNTYTVTTSESYSLQLSSPMFSDMSTVSVKVRTKGAGSSYGPWSEDVQVMIYAKPFASITIADSDISEQGIQVSSLPLVANLSVGARSGTLTQNVVQWRLVITSDESFVYKDMFGNDAVMAVGDAVVDISADSYDDGFTQPSFRFEVPATEAVFVTNISYTARVEALMDSGLPAEPASQKFTCLFEGGLASPSASIVTMPDWSARIYPSIVEEREIADGEGYVLDVDVLKMASIGSGDTYEVVVSYTDDEGDPRTWTSEWDGSEAVIDAIGMWPWASVQSIGYRASGSESEPIALTGSAYNSALHIENVLLSVFRIDRDGSMSIVGDNLPNSAGVFATDRHPAFGEMAYRIVANDQVTDEMSVIDVSGDNNWKSILIQWNEDGAAYDGNDGDEDRLTFGFEFVELPWNITVSTSGSKDVAYKRYVGRQHPVALYGTQVGSTGSWSCEIVKFSEDYELGQLRKLESYMGECWVREPSGLTYPANVDVNITRAYDNVAVSVHLEVTRIDGD